LAQLVRRLRDARDRASDIARQQRREMRGKAVPKGQAPATGAGGTLGKRDLIAAALKRANRETGRRRAQAAKAEKVASARRALAMKETAGRPERPASRSADEGMNPLPSEDIAPSGAFDAEGHRPVLERSRKVR